VRQMSFNMERRQAVRLVKAYLCSRVDINGMQKGRPDVNMSSIDIVLSESRPQRDALIQTRWRGKSWGLQIHRHPGFAPRRSWILELLGWVISTSSGGCHRRSWRNSLGWHPSKFTVCNINSQFGL